MFECLNIYVKTRWILRIFFLFASKSNKWKQTNKPTKTNLVPNKDSRRKNKNKFQIPDSDVDNIHFVISPKFKRKRFDGQPSPKLEYQPNNAREKTIFMIQKFRKKNHNNNIRGFFLCCCCILLLSFQGENESNWINPKASHLMKIFKGNFQGKFIQFSLFSFFWKILIILKFFSFSFFVHSTKKAKNLMMTMMNELI